MEFQTNWPTKHLVLPFYHSIQGELLCWASKTNPNWETAFQAAAEKLTKYIKHETENIDSIIACLNLPKGSKNGDTSLANKDSNRIQGTRCKSILKRYAKLPIDKVQAHMFATRQHDEMVEYLGNNWPISPNEDIISYWKRQIISGNLPILGRIALQYLSIPDSSAAVERCYHLYDLEMAPLNCGYQDLPLSEPSKRRPHSIYISQSFSAWLKWFIPQVEDSIELFKQQVQTQDGFVSDYQQLKAWDHLYPKPHKSHENTMQLSFSLFVDWFNPLTNKLAGKQVSIGVLALNCLNLPPAMQWKMQYTFISGIVPAPNQPNMITINNILCECVDKLIKLNSGIHISTDKHLNGRKIIVKLGCLIGDIVVTHKIAGFASHSATCFT
ncbi:hypothetical protein O181_040859 [Austropuccinia psidii MF-1]|uniref:HAT C-terminal dimerisation domain-containing protein n=1 Tax=Austropuccinia psidii MF-1 TaxID=1389203 RepID=A0A9Q3HFY5_9BASI|nr:hypothetical protein [Austropuccinia psidii MF-1]